MQQQQTPLNQPPSQPSPSAAGHKPEASSTAVGCVGLLAIVLMLLGGYFLFQGCQAGSSSDSNPDIRYAGEVTTALPRNPATIAFTASVTNNSDTTGTPECTVRFQDAGGSYSGFDKFTLANPLAPGETANFRGDVVIKNEGAQYVTEQSIECSES